MGRSATPVRFTWQDTDRFKLADPELFIPVWASGELSFRGGGSEGVAPKTSTCQGYTPQTHKDHDESKEFRSVKSTQEFPAEVAGTGY